VVDETGDKLQWPKVMTVWVWGRNIWDSVFRILLLKLCIWHVLGGKRYKPAKSRDVAWEWHYITAVVA